jgi:hypothetical protein
LPYAVLLPVRRPSGPGIALHVCVRWPRFLAEDVDCHYLPTAPEYAAALTAAGFVDVRLEDVSALWAVATHARAAAFAADADRFRRVVHGDEAVQLRLQVRVTRNAAHFARVERAVASSHVVSSSRVPHWCIFVLWSSG